MEGLLPQSDAGHPPADAGTDSGTPLPMVDAGPPPPALEPLPGAVAVAAGDSHACALLGDGTVWCWGNNQSGQLGDATNDSRPFAAPVVGLDDAIVVAAGGFHSCALRVGGVYTCWGENREGQLGSGNSRGTNIPVEGIGEGWLALSLGRNHTCGINDSGEVRCWGSNDFRQLGVGDTGDRERPTSIVGGEGRGIDVAAGELHTCAAIENGRVACWGFNADGQLGTGARENANRWTLVEGMADAVSVTVGEAHSCATTDSGQLYCWGSNGRGELGLDGEIARTPTAVPQATSVATVVGGSRFTCSTTTSSALLCWGENAAGQLGDGTTDRRATAVAVSGLESGVAAFDLGHDFACAVTHEGGVRCWGRNDRGQLGDTTAEPANTPTTVLRETQL